MTEDREISRTQRKKEATALQKMGEKLAALNDEQLKTMDLSVELMAAIRDLRPMSSHGARRRQTQYIGALMRAVDVAPIERALLEIEQGAYKQARAFHRLEDWRDRLVAGDDEAMEEILTAFVRADRQRLGHLVRSARKAREKNATKRSARNLFRYLKELSDHQS